MSSAFRLSIGLNIVLAVAVAVLFWRGQSAARLPNTAAARPTSAWTQAPKTGSVPNELQPLSAGPSLTPAVIAQLEQQGISRDILACALLEDFNRRWDRWLIERQKKYAPKQMSDQQYVEFGRLRDAEQVRELKEAFGEEGYLAWDKTQTLRALNTTDLAMTAEEAEQAYRLQKDFDQKCKELQLAMEDGVADNADGGTLQSQAQDALNLELEKLFGKQRLNEMRGISEPIAEVHSKYADLNPTADQVKSVLQTEGDYHARETALAERLKANPGDASNVTAELKAMNEAREENLRRIFGAEAYDTMKRQNDPTYKTLQQYAGAWELKREEIQSVYEALHGFQDQTEQTRTAAAMSEAAGQPVNWPAIDSAIEQARQQTETSLQNLIGRERLRRLRQNGILTTR